MRLRRAGFTLSELLVSLAIASVVAGAAMMTLVRQQKFYEAASEALDVRSQLRDAADVLASDIRGSAAATYGFPVMNDSAIEMYTTIGTSVVCESTGSNQLGLAPSVLANGNTLTSLLVVPDTGDIAAFYTIPSGNPDSARWDTRRIASFTTRSMQSSCPESTGFTSAADAAAGATAYQVTIAAPVVAIPQKGAPVRFLRRARYSIYRSSDNLWYLGYRRCGVVAPFACGAIQPVSGPYRPYGGVAATGLSFRFYSQSGFELASPDSGLAVTRVDIVVRGQSKRDVAFNGDSRKLLRDSVIVSVSPRNRLR